MEAEVKTDISIVLRLTSVEYERLRQGAAHAGEQVCDYVPRLLKTALDDHINDHFALQE